MRITTPDVRQTARDLLALDEIAYIKMRTRTPGDYLKHFYNLDYVGANEKVEGLFLDDDKNREAIPMEKLVTRVTANQYGIHKLRIMWDPSTVIINELDAQDKIAHYCTFFASKLYKFTPGVIEECWLTLEKTFDPLIRQRTVLLYLAMEPCEDVKVIWKSSVNKNERDAVSQYSLFDR